ncbi:hypothetical protein KUTeg_004339 [Tegillarca granosa]|uniref:Uncharacterized protein n=1 Tax=Tegillarca granosa TaxID=220873 RepID=A0ABQ9FPP3_TEGGR|nr:hypothetical protein KUTeg_004339 [Tegillarca granosa]
MMFRKVRRTVSKSPKIIITGVPVSSKRCKICILNVLYFDKFAWYTSTLSGADKNLKTTRTTGHNVSSTSEMYISYCACIHLNNQNIMQCLELIKYIESYHIRNKQVDQSYLDNPSGDKNHADICKTCISFKSIHQLGIELKHLRLTRVVRETLFISLSFPGVNVRGSTSRTRDRMPTRLSLGSSGRGRDNPNDSTQQTETKISESRLATPSSGGRISFKGSGLPIPVGNPSTDSAKLRRIMQDTRSHNVQLKQRP